jgi:hypothetical protein
MAQATASKTPRPGSNAGESPPQKGAAPLFIPLDPYLLPRSDFSMGAALLDRHPPHFSTDFYKRAVSRQKLFYI